MIDPEYQAEWDRDCLKYRNMLLSGKFSHWCADWDGLPVDETVPEWDGCLCFFVEKPKEAYFVRVV